MGWDFQHIEKGTPTIDVLRREINGEYEIIAHAVKGGAAYLAVRPRCEGDEGPVEAVVVLVNRKGRDYYNFGTKWMDERMGPYYYDCPARILDLLTPTDSEMANEWRSKCRAKIVAVKAHPKVAVGDKVRFAQPLEFEGGDTLDTFIFKGGSKFTDPSYAWSPVYRITRWRDRAHEVVA